MASADREIENTPLPELVKQLGLAIGAAQLALDRNAIDLIRDMTSDDEANYVTINDQRRSLLELGFVPTFYHFTRATIEARVAFKSFESQEIGASVSVSGGAFVGYGFVAASVSASYSNKYGFEASGSSVISTELVSVPPPAALAEIISRMTAAE